MFPCHNLPTLLERLVGISRNPSASNFVPLVRRATLVSSRNPGMNVSKTLGRACTVECINILGNMGMFTMFSMPSLQLLAMAQSAQRNFAWWRWSFCQWCRVVSGRTQEDYKLNKIFFYKSFKNFSPIVRTFEVIWANRVLCALAFPYISSVSPAYTHRISHASSWKPLKKDMH